MTPDPLNVPHPDDERLARLLAEGLRRGTAAPVDEAQLLAGARHGAARIRRRRSTALAAAVVLAAGVPLGLLGRGLFGPRDVVTAGSAASEQASAPADASQPPAAAGSRADGEWPGLERGAGAGTSESSQGLSTATSPMPSVPPPTVEPLLSSAAPTALPRLATGQVPVPARALLAATDAPAAGLTSTSDTANAAPVPPAPAGDTCGTVVSGPDAAGSREITYERREGTTASWWTVTSTVRVFSGTGAASYLEAARKLDCVTPADSLGDGAVLGRGDADAAGRSHWYGVVRVGRVVSEVRLAVPYGTAMSSDQLLDVLRTATARLNDSGLAAAAAADPGLS